MPNACFRCGEYKAKEGKVLCPECFILARRGVKGTSWFPDGNGHYVREDGLSSVEKPRRCSKCDKRMASKQGNILCGPCKEMIESYG